MIRDKVRKYLLDLKGKQLLGKQGGLWPNMLVFWLLCLSIIALAILIYMLVSFREYPLYAKFEDIQCHDAIHIKSGRGRAAHVQIFDVGGEELIIRGSFAGTSGILYVDRMFESDHKYHICFIRLQDIFLDDNSRLFGLWRQDSNSKGELDRELIESNINHFNNRFKFLIDISFYPILFVVCFMITVGIFIKVVFFVSIFE